MRQLSTCDEAGITLTMPKRMTSSAKAASPFRQAGLCLLGRGGRLSLSGGREADLSLQQYRERPDAAALLDRSCGRCVLKGMCTTGKERRITRFEKEHVLEAVQERLDANPQAMRQRRETAEHPFGTIKARMGATHFLTRTLPKVATEMALAVLAYNLTRVMNIMGVKPMIAAIKAEAGCADLRATLLSGHAQIVRRCARTIEETKIGRNGSDPRRYATVRRYRHAGHYPVAFSRNQDPGRHPSALALG